MTRTGRIALLAWAVAMGGCGYWLARHLVVTTELSAFLPEVSTPTQALLVSQLRDGVAARLIMIGLERSDAGEDAAALANASRALALELAADPRFGFVANGDASRLLREQALVREWRYLLSPAVLPERFTAEGLRTALGDALSLLASPLGPLVKPLLSSDPTGEILRLAPLLAGSGGATLYEGVWFSADRRRALLVAQTRAPGFDLDAQQQAAVAIEGALQRAAAKDVRLVMSSPGLLAVESRRLIQSDVRLASWITLVGVVLLLIATYRSVWPIALSALPALSGLATGVVAVSVAFGPVHAITLGFGAMLIGEAIDYPTYLFANNATGESLEATQRRIGSTLTLAVATTACGALAMLLSGFRGLAQLGLLIIVGVVIAGLVTRYVLPAATPARALARKRGKSPLDATRALPLLRRHAWAVMFAVAAAAVMLLVRRDVLWDDDLSNLNPVPAASKELDRELRVQSGAPDLRYLVVATGSDREAALVASERIVQVLDRAVDERVIASFDLAARYLPSEATQRRRQQALPDTATLTRNLDAALAELPFRRDAFEPFVAEVGRTRGGARLSRAALGHGALALKVDSLLVQSDGRWTALVPVSGVIDPPALRARITGHDDVVLLDLKAETDALVAGYRAQSLRSTLLGLVAIVAVLYAGVRSIPATLKLLAPVLAAVLLTAGTLVATGARLTIFHLVAMLLVVGVGLNYALFFGRRHRCAAERDLTLLSVTVAGLATLCASIALALTGTPVLRAIGLTTGLGAVFAFAVSAAVSRESE